METRLELEGLSVEDMSIKALGDVAHRMAERIDRIYRESTPETISKEDLARLGEATEDASKLAGKLLRIGR